MPKDTVYKRANTWMLWRGIWAGFSHLRASRGRRRLLYRQNFGGHSKQHQGKYPDCAITLSLGEKSYESYKLLYEAGADRYLLRHETANAQHYSKLHPPVMSLKTETMSLQSQRNRIPGRLRFYGRFTVSDHGMSRWWLNVYKRIAAPHGGIGPFIPHKDTPFAGKPAGTLELTLFLLGIIRLMLPYVLLPATTALAQSIPKAGNWVFLQAQTW